MAMPLATSTDKHARPLKRRALSPTSKHSASVEALFANPPPIPPEGALTTSGNKLAPLPAPPEIVANVQGSSAGAGSGEFHVYKASRRREYERLARMDEESRNEDGDREWAAQMEEKRRIDEEATERKRAKRRGKGGKGGGGGGGIKDKNGSQMGNNGTGLAKRLETKQLPTRNGDARDVEDDHEGTAVAAVEEKGIMFADED